MGFKGQYGIMDMECIQITKTHKCVRKLFILTKNSSLNQEFYPCKRYSEIARKYQESFRYCKKHVHRLKYDPWNYSPDCKVANQIVKKFINEKKVEFILYKGGDVERNMFEFIGIPSYNIETLAGITKAGCHDPETEVRFHYNQLLKFGHLDQQIGVH